MKDHDLPQQPSRPAPEENERYEREKAQDEQRYRHYLETGECISHEEMMAWLDRLEHNAGSKASRLLSD